MSKKKMFFANDYKRLFMAMIMMMMMMMMKMMMIMITKLINQTLSIIQAPQ